MTGKKKQQVVFVAFIVFLGVLFGVPTANARVSGTRYMEVTAMPPVSASNNQVFLPVVSKPPERNWPMVAANPQRTSWTPEEVRGDLSVAWYRPFEPYIPDKIQPIAANGKIYVSSARGLYAVNASDGQVAWVFPTELPLGNAPTIATVPIEGVYKSVAYVGGYDRKVHALDALTGVVIPGYTAFEAQAGFETNPLVINNTIYAGNRDGYFYALDAITGAKSWAYQTEGPILFSAAYKDNILYFASNDAHAYALNASDGSLVWKSPKLPGAGFHSFWPVIYTDKISGKDYVVFTGSENYRQEDLSLTFDESSRFFSSCHPNCPWGTLIGATSTAADNSYWAPGTVQIDASTLTNYFEDHSSRRTVFVLDRITGQEYTFDSDGDGKPEYAPFSWANVTQSGNKYPPIIGADGVYYQSTAYASAPWIARGDIVGWKFGTHLISRVQEIDVAHAVDEPMAFSSGGRLIYWLVTPDNEAGAIDTSKPYGQPNRAWRYFAYNLAGLAPAYDSMYHIPTGWGLYVYGSDNGIYSKSGSAQSPLIPYQGKVYLLKTNALLAFSPTAAAPTKLPLAATIQVQNSPTAPAASQLKEKLETEIQKMLSAGPLRPGYHAAGYFDLYGDGQYTDERELGEIFDYFQNPADTVATLIATLPYLSPSTQQQVKSYIQSNYGPGAQYDLTKVVHVGWGSGAARETFDLPQEVWVGPKGFGAPYHSPLNPSTQPICGSCSYWTTFPPYSFYAAWKYTQVFGDAASIFSAMRTKLEPIPSDSYLTRNPYMNNLYIAGYLGYLNLQSMAGSPESPNIRNTYNHLLSLRSTTFSKDVPWSGFDYHQALAISRNFMFLTPELADYLSQNIKPQVKTALDEYQNIAPYWFVSKYDQSFGEGTLQHLYDSPALFQANAYIMKAPYSDLVKYLDVPAFAHGDLFYIQDLTAALSASPSP